jgi:hypothetical protein
VIGLHGGVVAAALGDGDGRLLVLDRAGTLLAASAPFTRPRYNRWSVTAARLDRGRLSVAWESHDEILVGGAPTLDPIEPPAPQQGGLAVDLATAAVAVIDVASALPRPIELPASERAVALYRDPMGAPVLWRAGDQIAALVVAPAGDALLLRTWTVRDGQPRLTRQVVDHLPEPGYFAVMPALDGLHVFLLGCKQRGSDLTQGVTCVWRGYAVATGDQVTEHPAEAGITQMTIVGDRVLDIMLPTAQANPLRAFDRATGAPVWDHPIYATRWMSNAP